MFKKWFSKGEARPAYPLISATDFSLVWGGITTPCLFPTGQLASRLKRSAMRKKNQHWNNAAASWLSKLGDIASDDGLDKHVVMVLPNEDDYYRYVSEYMSEHVAQDGEFAYSGGMFL